MQKDSMAPTRSLRPLAVENRSDFRYAKNGRHHPSKIVPISATCSGKLKIFRPPDPSRQAIWGREEFFKALPIASDKFWAFKHNSAALKMCSWVIAVSVR